MASHDAHLDALRRIKQRKPGSGTVDSVAPACMQMSHLRVRAKKKQLAATRRVEIERDNARLLTRMAMIITSSKEYPTRRVKKSKVYVKNEPFKPEVKPYYNRKDWRAEQLDVLKRLQRWPPFEPLPKEQVVEPPKPRKRVPYTAPLPRPRRPRPLVVVHCEEPVSEPPREPDTSPSSKSGSRSAKRKNPRSAPPIEETVVVVSHSGFKPGRYPVKMPTQPACVSDAADFDTEATDSCDLAITPRCTVAFATHARCLGGNVHLRLDCGDLARTASITTKMPALALVDPDATHNFVAALARRALVTATQQHHKAALAALADGTSEDDVLDTITDASLADSLQQILRDSK